MDLVSLFQRHATSAVWARFSQLPALDGALGGILTQGLHRFPQIALPAEPFLAFLARHLPIDIPEGAAIAALHGHELYLVCAYGLGDRAASDILESQYFPDVRTALYRLHATADVVAEIIQELRHVLIALQDPSSQQRGYSGRGNLAGWLRVVAVRKVGKHRRGEQRHRSLDDVATQILPGPMPGVDTVLLQHTYKQQFAEAFQRAVASLSSRQRNVLRYHFLVRLSIDQIAKMYGVHRATAARWIHSAQQELAQKTRAEFQRLVPIGDDSVADLMALIQSQLSLSLGAWLYKDAEPEGTA